MGPVWSWSDPFSTLYDIIAWIGRRLGLSGVTPQPWPSRSDIWPAVAGFALFAWLELVAFVLQGRVLSMVMIGYTVITLLGMARYGRDTWRTHAETFSVWIALVGRLAPYALADQPETGRVIRRPFARGLVTGRWTLATLIIGVFLVVSRRSSSSCHGARGSQRSGLGCCPSLSATWWRTISRSGALSLVPAGRRAAPRGRHLRPTATGLTVTCGAGCDRASVPSDL